MPRFTLAALAHCLLDLPHQLLALLYAIVPPASLPTALTSYAALILDHLNLCIAVLPRPFTAKPPGLFHRAAYARALRLDPPQYQLECRHVETCTVDGGRVTLRGTLWLPKGAAWPLPTVIIRSPYGGGERSEWGQGVLAERGYAVLLQDTRGRFGSDGEFVPVENEREDGAATVRWARAQPWCNGRIGVYGVSYLGLTAWACLGACAPGELQAAVPVATQSRVRSVVARPGGAFSLELLNLWVTLVYRILVVRSLGELFRLLRAFSREGLFLRANSIEPLCHLDSVLLGRPWPFFQDAISADEDSLFWGARDELCALGQRRGGDGAAAQPLPPIHLVAGWHDFFSEQQLRDFEAAAALSPQVRLTVGPFDHWGFVSIRGLQLLFRCLLACVDEHLMQVPPMLRFQQFVKPLGPRRSGAEGRGGPWTPRRGDSSAYVTPDSRRSRPRLNARGVVEVPEAELPVQVCLLLTQRWVGLAAWPPPESTELKLHLAVADAPKGLLGRRLDSHHRLVWAPPSPPRASPRAAPPPAAGAAHVDYIYSPSSPTPCCGGPSFNPVNSGERSQRAIERRDDVLVFTSPPLDRPIVVAGTVKLRLRAAADAPSIDLVGRLCAVRRGLSVNVCEGLLRVDAATGGDSVGGGTEGEGGDFLVTLGPVAAEFDVGSQIRLHVCSAAHPRWMRNLCADPAVAWFEQKCGTDTKVRVWSDGSSRLELPALSL